MNEAPELSASGMPMRLPLPEVLNSLPDGVYVTDTDRKILFWNKAAERITGWRAEEVVGRSCSDNILVHVDKDGHRLCGCEHCPLHRSMVTGQASTEAVVIFAQRKFGDSAPLEVSVAPIRDGAGQVIGGIEIFRDVTESMQDLLRAKVIQEETISCGLPEDNRLEIAVRYQPREIVGGDFFRIECSNHDHYRLLVADAMGHGVAAALHTMQLRSLWEDHRAELESPARFLNLLNRRLHALVRDAGYFATGICGSYDAARGQLRCVRAGHPAPWLFRNSGLVEPIGTPQLALGMLPGTHYVETSTHMEPGDALLIFTDGAVEVFDAHERQLGCDGLKRLVLEQERGGAPGAFRIEELEQQLLKYSDSIHLLDDLTLLKLRRVPG